MHTGRKLTRARSSGHLSTASAVAVARSTDAHGLDHVCVRTEGGAIGAADDVHADDREVPGWRLAHVVGRCETAPGFPTFADLNASTDVLGTLFAEYANLLKNRGAISRRTTSAVALDEDQPPARARVASLSCCNFAAAQVP